MRLLNWDTFWFIAKVNEFDKVMSDVEDKAKAQGRRPDCTDHAVRYAWQERPMVTSDKHRGWQFNP